MTTNSLRSLLSSTVLVLIGAIALVPVQGSAQIFEKVTIGAPVLENTADARSGGMGGAMVSIADGPFATIWNPAGLTLRQGVSVLPVAYHPMQLPTPFEFVEPEHWTSAASFASHHFGIGFSYSRFDYGNAAAVRSVFRGIGDLNLSQSSLHMSAAFDVGGFLFPDEHFVASVGVTSKRLQLASDVQGWEWDMGTLLGYRFTPGNVVVQPQIGVNVRDLVDGEIERNGDVAGRFDRSALLGGSVRVVPSWESTMGPVLQVLASAQTDTYYGETKRKSIVRSGLELVTFGLVTGRAGVRHDNETSDTFHDFGFGLGTDRLHIGKYPVEIRADYASVDDGERSSMYSLIASLGL